jgi:hypothetical protein
MGMTSTRNQVWKTVGAFLTAWAAAADMMEWSVVLGEGRGEGDDEEKRGE